jgi:hypothetical protein
MQTRLLAFLADTQSSLFAERPEPRPDTSWHTSRSVNYRQGLARLVLGAKDKAGKVTPLGTILVQSFKLADGTPCLKAHLAWPESDGNIMHPIYAKPFLDWANEAAQLASAWLSGPPAKMTPVIQDTELLAAG